MLANILVYVNFPVPETENVGVEVRGAVVVINTVDVEIAETNTGEVVDASD